MHVQCTQITKHAKVATIYVYVHTSYSKYLNTCNSFCLRKVQELHVYLFTCM